MYDVSGLLDNQSTLALAVLMAAVHQQLIFN